VGCRRQRCNSERVAQRGSIRSTVGAIWILVTLSAFMTACRDSTESHYPTTVAAAQAGMFDRGWLPEILKPDAGEITVWYDIASNEVRGKFALNPAVTERVRSTCKTASDVPRKTWWMPNWFPASITTGAPVGLQIFRCNDYFVATDGAQGKGYFWETERQYPRSMK